MEPAYWIKQYPERTIAGKVEVTPEGPGLYRITLFRGATSVWPGGRRVGYWMEDRRVVDGDGNLLDQVRPARYSDWRLAAFNFKYIIFESKKARKERDGRPRPEGEPRRSRPRVTYGALNDYRPEPMLPFDNGVIRCQDIEVATVMNGGVFPLEGYSTNGDLTLEDRGRGPALYVNGNHHGPLGKGKDRWQVPARFTGAKGFCGKAYFFPKEEENG